MTSRRGFLLGTAVLAVSHRVRADEPQWGRLRRGGLVLLMRHAETEGGLGDPQGFRLDDCATQRNLSAAGREHARRVGARLRAERVPVAQVLTSPWCRCRETASLAFGAFEDWEPLSSFFERPHLEAEAIERVKRRIAGYASRKRAGNVVMVTHSVNIAGLTRHAVAPAEIVVVRPEGCCEVRPVERLAL
jgi:broad specificity phosphatase PhoE